MKFSIITVCRDRVAHIRDAIESVLSQECVEVEYIVIDAASTDGTVDIIREYEGRLKYVSEPDKGMYDGLNKGIRMATGDVIGIVNSDDVLASDDTLAQIAAQWEKEESKLKVEVEGEKPRLDAIYGDIRFVPNTTRGLAAMRTAPTTRYCTGRFFRPWQMRFGFQVAHPSFYCRREVFARLGPYLIDRGMYADFELLVRYLVKSRIRTAYLPLCTTVMRAGGASTNGLQATRKITRSDHDSLRLNGIWTCTPLLLIRLPFKVFGLVFKHQRSFK